MIHYSDDFVKKTGLGRECLMAIPWFGHVVYFFGLQKLQCISV